MLPLAEEDALMKKEQMLPSKMIHRDMIDNWQNGTIAFARWLHAAFNFLFIVQAFDYFLRFPAMSRLSLFLIEKKAND